MVDFIIGLVYFACMLAAFILVGLWGYLVLEIALKDLSPELLATLVFLFKTWVFGSVFLAAAHYFRRR